MALVTHQVQGSYATCPSRPMSQNKVIELRRFATALHKVVKTDRFLPLRCKSCLSVGASLVRGPKAKTLRIAAFKGSANNDETGGRLSGSKTTKNSVKLSYVQEENENTLIESPDRQDVQLPYTSGTDETISGSLAIQKLFKNWLTLLQTPSTNQAANETTEGPDPGKVSVMQNGVQKEKRGEILKAIWCYFWGLDATVKIPLLIFTPLYLAVNIAYGAEVSKELTPLWVFGPLIVALYVKMFRGICALYVFSFKQTVNILRNLPTYYVVVYTYIARGKLKEDLHAHLWQPVLDIKNKDYKKFSRIKMKQLEVWAVEKYLDFVESIWPYYCRAIRFLKRANLI